MIKSSKPFSRYSPQLSSAPFLLMSLVAYIANNMDPDQSAPIGNSLIRAHSVWIVCFYSLRPSQQFFSYVRMDLPGLNQYKARINVFNHRV